MDRPGDRGVDAESAHGARSEALMAAAELKRRKQESCRRLGQIDEERRVLEEISDSLASEEQALARRLTSAREEKDRLAEKIAFFTRRGVEMGGELEELEREIAILDRRHSENTARERDLAVEIASAQEDLAAARNEISHLSEELEMDRTALARMDRRLSLGGAKR